MQSPIRTMRHFNFADAIAWRLEEILPRIACSAAAATCKIQLMGWRKGNHNGQAPRNSYDEPFRGQGRWVHTSLQTFGHSPSPRFRTTVTGKWAYADSFEAVNVILGCFDIEMNDVIEHFGNVGEEEKMEWDLVDIVEALAPQYIAAPEISTKVVAAA